MQSYLSLFLGPIGSSIFYYIALFPVILILASFVLKRLDYTSRKKMGIMLYLFFLAIALGLVLLPFPSFSEAFCLQRSQLGYWQLTPFNIFNDIQDYAQRKQLHGLMGVLYNRAVLQGVFNIFLILPLGFIGALIFNWSFKKALIVGLLTTLSFEVTQGSGLFGLVPCPYRLFDVDDLWLNTLGFILGWAFTLMFRESFNEWVNNGNKSLASPMDLVKRLVALVIDIVVLIILMFSTNWNFDVVAQFASQFSINKSVLGVSVNTLISIMYFVIVPYLFKGKTIGLWIVRLKNIDSTNAQLSLMQLLKRYSLILVAPISLTLVTIAQYTLPSMIFSWVEIGYVIFLIFLILIWLVVTPMSIELDAQGRSFVERWVGTRLVNKNQKP